MTTSVFHYRVEFGDGRGMIKTKQKFEVTELKVLGANEINIVVDDLHFTTLRRAIEKDDIYKCIGKPSIQIFCDSSTWGSSVWFSLFTYSRVPATTIRAQIRAAVKKKVGYFNDRVDLNFIKDTAQQ